MGPISTESFGEMVFAVQGWKAAAIPSALFSRGLHFSLLPVILFTVGTKYQLDFSCWIYFSHYKWVEVILCCSWSDGATCGEDEGVRRAASSGRGWGLLAAAGAASPCWAMVRCDEPRWEWMNMIFVSKPNVFESELSPRLFQSSLSRRSCVFFASYGLLYRNAELQNIPAGVRAHQAHGEVMAGPAWTLQGGRTWVPCQGTAPVSSLLTNLSVELYMRREKGCVLSLGCSYLPRFTPVESNTVTLTSVFLSGQWSKATGENASPLAFLLIWFIIASSPQSCQRAACANPKEPAVMTETGKTDQGISCVVVQF